MADLFTLTFVVAVLNAEVTEVPLKYGMERATCWALAEASNEMIVGEQMGLFHGDSNTDIEIRFSVICLREKSTTK